MTSTSGTKTFNLEFDELFDAACLRVGGEHVTGRDAKTGRRALNLLLIDLINRGVPLATLEEFETTMSSSIQSYTLDSAIVDVTYAVLARSSVETVMGRLNLYDFKAIPKKDQPSKPTQYTTYRGRDAVILNVWPLPENSTDIIKYWAITKIEDVTKQDQYVDLPTRALPMLVAGLAYYLGMEKLADAASLQKIQALKADYEEHVTRYLEEDRERSTMRLVPTLSRI